MKQARSIQFALCVLSTILLCTLRDARAQADAAGSGATINIRARTIDGLIPTNVAVRISPFLTQNNTNWPPSPVVVGSNGDWVATNVSPGAWEVNLESTNYFGNPRGVGFNGPTANSLRVIARENYSVSFTLSYGITYTGRVVDAETSQPIAGVSMNGARTDADGRYRVEHQGVTLTAWSSNYVQQQKIYRPATPEGGNRAIETGTNLSIDFKLQRGGWIVGKIIPPPGAPDNLIPGITIKRNSSSLFPPVYPEFGPTNAFRIGPLPPGSYQLDVDLTAASLKGGPRNPWRARGQVTGIDVKAWQVSSNVVVETK